MASGHAWWIASGRGPPAQPRHQARFHPGAGDAHVRPPHARVRGPVAPRLRRRSRHPQPRTPVGQVRPGLPNSRRTTRPPAAARSGTAEVARFTSPYCDGGDSMTGKQLYGGETAKAVANFPISGETVPVSVVRWLARIKGASAAVNGE